MFLVKNKDATEFLTSMSTDTARRVFLGDPDKVTAGVKPYVLAAHMESNRPIAPAL